MSAQRNLITRFLCCGAAFVAAALATLTVAAPALHAQGIVVIVNDDPISSYDVDQRMRFIALTTRQQPSEQLRKEALEMLIDERLQLQEGKKLDINADEADVTRALSGMAERNEMDVAKLTAAFEQAGVNIVTLKNRIRAAIVWQQVVRQKFRYDAMLLQDELKRDAGIDSSSDGGAAPQFKLQQVRLAVPSNAGDAAVAQRLAEAERLRANFKSCDSIQSLVQNVAGASVRDLGAKSAAEMAPQARTLVMNAKVGQMTPPSVAADGIELYAVCGKTTPAKQEARKEAANDAIQKEFEIRGKRLLRDLRQGAFIDYR